MSSEIAFTVMNNKRDSTDSTPLFVHLLWLTCALFVACEPTATERQNEPQATTQRQIAFQSTRGQRGDRDSAYVDLSIQTGTRQVRAQAIQRVNFGDGKARSFLGEGWSRDEHDGKDRWVWALAPAASMELSLSEIPTSLELAFELKTFAPQQVIQITMNGRPLGAIKPKPQTRDKRQTYSLGVPSSVLREGKNELRMMFSTFGSSPTDSRPMAAAFRWLELRPKAGKLILERPGYTETLASHFASASVSWFVFVPAGSNLVFGLKGRWATDLAVWLHTSEGRERVWSAPRATSSAELAQQFVVDLSPFAGSYATVEFGGFGSGSGDASETRLLHPRIVGPADMRERPDILLITLDSLRYDRVSGNGYLVPTTPALDKLYEESAVFDSAVTQSSWTMPSLLSIMTAKHPGEYNYLPFGLESADERIHTLAELLSAHGYYAIGATSHDFSSSRYGFARGFDAFSDHHYSEGYYRNADDLVAALEALWNRAPRTAPVFVWVHVFEPHWPYVPERQYFSAVHPQHSEEYDHAMQQALRKSVGKYWPHHPAHQPMPEKLLKAYERAYDGNIRKSDDTVRRILDIANAHVDLEDTIIALTSDHGEAIDEEGWYFTHSQSLHQNQLHVPLLVRYPKSVKPERRSVPVAVGGMLPTLFKLAKLPLTDVEEGLSMKSYFAYTPDDYIVAELFNSNNIHRLPESDQRQYSVISQGLQTILYPGRTEGDLEHYAVQGGRWEPVAPGAHGLDRRSMFGVLTRTGIKTDGATVELSDYLSSEEQERLRALGYLE